MRITRLQIQNFRILDAVDIEPAPGINWFFGANGAGKTSLVEAVYVLAKGRSFRSGLIAPLVGPASEQFHVVTRITERAGRARALGTARGTGGWQGRIDGQSTQRVAEFARRLPLVLIEPGSHALIEGGPSERRQYLDWTLFHVEHDYLDRWRRHARQLRQRNAALRDGAKSAVLDTFEQALVSSAQELHDAREGLVARLNTLLEPLKTSLGVRLGELSLIYRPGWPQDTELASALRSARQQDRERGHTRHGPHRAELVPLVDGEPAGRRLSRGQQKLLSLLLLLAQHGILAETARDEPLLLLDDPVSELDAEHLEQLWQWVGGRGGQIWVTALAPPNQALSEGSAVFHVEHGVVEHRGSRS